MRVLHIGLSNNPGGIEAFAISYFRELSKKGVVFDFIDIYGEGIAFENEISKMGGKIFTLKNYKQHPLKAKKDIERIIQTEQYKCVHINMLSAANILPAVVALKEGLVPILHAHNNKTEGLLRLIMHSVNVHKLRKMSSVRLACGYAAGKWMWGNSEFQVIPNAINIEEFSFNQADRLQIRNEYQVKYDDILLGFVGRLTAQKNPLYLLDILEATKERLGNNVKLMIVGDGELRDVMRKRIAQMRLEDAVIFVGKQFEVNKFYSAMDCFLLPSKYEGFGIVAVEAQASGLPCCLSNAVPNEAKITPYTVSLPIPDDAHKWAEKIEQFVNIDVNRANNSLVDSIYNIKNAALQMQGIYLKLEKN